MKEGSADPAPAAGLNLDDAAVSVTVPLAETVAIGVMVAMAGVTGAIVHQDTIGIVSTAMVVVTIAIAGQVGAVMLVGISGKAWLIIDPDAGAKDQKQGAAVQVCVRMGAHHRIQQIGDQT